MVNIEGKTLGFECKDINEVEQLINILVKTGYKVYKYDTFSRIFIANRVKQVEECASKPLNNNWFGDTITWVDLKEFFNSETPNPFPNGAKFSCRNEREFDLVEKKLLELGYFWDPDEKKSTLKVRSPNSLFIYVSSSGVDRLTHGTTYAYYKSSLTPAYNINHEVFFTKVEVETLQIEGKVYNKAEVIERLQSLKEVK